MHGIPTTHRQVATYMRERNAGSSQQKSADIAGLSDRTARRLDHCGTAAKGPRTYRTREDAFAAVWESFVVPLLNSTKPLQAKMMFVALQRKFPYLYSDSLQRSFERRVRSWRAVNGASRETFFPQEHPPGWQSIMDFTVCNDLQVTIAGQAFPHRLGHFRLACSGWSFANVVLGGESYTALAETLRQALELIGGVTQTLRTDSLSAAFKNLSQHQDLTTRFNAICRHYGCEATRNNRGEAHENGSIESPNGHLKTAIDQELILRISRDFADLTSYRSFVAAIVAERNRSRHAEFLSERSYLRPLPSYPPVTWSEAMGVVSNYSLIRVLHKSYMLPSRLNGHRLAVRIYDDHLEFYHGQNHVQTCPRLHGDDRSRQVNYRLIIGSLIRKPGAFARLVYRDDLHPRPIFARTWAVLRDRLSEHAACRAYVRLLHLAHEHVCEDALAQRLDALLEAGAVPDVDALRAELARPRLATIPTVTVPDPNPTTYDRLLAQPLALPQEPAIPA